MNVGVFIKDVDPKSGGAHTFQEEIMNALRDMSGQTKHSFVIFFSGKEERLPTDYNGGKITVVPSGYHWFRKVLSGFGETNVGQDVQSIFRKSFSSIPPKLIKQHKIEFFWFPTNHFLGMVDVPYITTVWDLQHRLQPWFPEVSANGEWGFREKYLKSVLQRATYIIAGTKAGKDEIVRFYDVPPERVKLLPHPTPAFSSSKGGRGVLDRLGIAPGYLFYPAQFWPHKNHVVLIKAVEYLKKNSGIKVNVVLCGSDKGNRDYIEDLTVKNGLQDQIHMAGFVSQADLVSLYQNALALVYPTFFGPENLPPLEAFGLGCPVIASNVSGAEEQLGSAALLFDPSDYVQLAKHIKLLLDKKNIVQQLIKKGRERAKQWTSKDFVKSVFLLLDEFEATRKAWPPPQ